MEAGLWFALVVFGWIGLYNIVGSRGTPPTLEELEEIKREVMGVKKPMSGPHPDIPPETHVGFAFVVGIVCMFAVYALFIK